LHSNIYSVILLKKFYREHHLTSNLFLILVIAFVVIVIAIACLSIGWLIAGKTKVEISPEDQHPPQS